MYRDNHKQILKALRLQNIAYKFFKNIDNIDDNPDDVKVFRQEFYDERSYTGYEPKPRH
ncbi:hypothetical protein CY0110_12432 [Crocosphaera chwakensis CCY0110]|uniref:Uncharacterized protein n=1 Tax=Crocosphaera chwakensis CCY0110 TaxID=391612 RepID=A3IXX4_9CHRO|nr:hypothetical protein CY0110_12432 [Crocosphaera chwakensis CCY0110]